MANSEASMVWAPLKREFDRRGWHYTRIENRVDPGTPDVNVRIPYLGDIWFELKYVRLKTKRGLCEGTLVDIGLRNEQFLWLRSARAAGRKCYLLVRIGDDFYTMGGETGWQLAKHPHYWQVFKYHIDRQGSLEDIFQGYS